VSRLLKLHWSVSVTHVRTQYAHANKQAGRQINKKQETKIEK